MLRQEKGAQVKAIEEQYLKIGLQKNQKKKRKMNQLKAMSISPSMESQNSIRPKVRKKTNRLRMSGMMEN